MFERLNSKKEIREPFVPQPIIDPSYYPTHKAEFAFTPKQKKYFHERDGDKCQAQGIIPHKETAVKHVHHTVPQELAQRLKINPDIPNNGILICENAHRKIHPDMNEFLTHYHDEHANKDFSAVIKERQKKLADKQIYHDDTWDRQLLTRIMQQEEKAKKKGLVFPPPAKKRI